MTLTTVVQDELALFGISDINFKYPAEQHQ